MVIFMAKCKCMKSLKEEEEEIVDNSNCDKLRLTEKLHNNILILCLVF